MPEIIRNKVNIGGAQCRSLIVSFKQFTKTILIVDDYYNLGEESGYNTFIRLCTAVCKAQGERLRFVYLSTRKATPEALKEFLEKAKADGITFVDDAPFKKCLLSITKYLFFVDDWKGRPTTLSSPFARWADTDEVIRGEKGKAMIGFNYKSLYNIVSGKNAFSTDDNRLFTDFPIRMLNTIEKVKRFEKLIKEQKVIACDTEGRNLKRVTNKIFTFQFGIWIDDRIETFIIPWEHRDHTWSKEDKAYIRKFFKRLFADPEKEFVFHFGQFDIGQICHILGWDYFPANAYDTVSGTFAEDENWKFMTAVYASPEFHNKKKSFSPYSLECLEYRHGLFRPKDILGKEDRENMERFSLQEIAQYGAYDVVSPLIIRKQQIEQSNLPIIGYKKRKHFHKLVLHQLGVMIKTFAALMNTGINIDLKNARALTKPGNVFERTLEKINGELLQTKEGKEANKIIAERQGLATNTGAFSSQIKPVLSLSKPKHRQVLFFEVAKLEANSVGASGDPSTDKAFQAKHKDVPIVKLYGQANKVRTLESNFAKSLVNKIAHDDDFKSDGRLRPIISFISVLTGRLSIMEPSMQNIPVRYQEDFDIHKDLVKGIKASYWAGYGRVYMGSDFSAHEVRLSGVIAKDPGVREAFLKANEAIRKYRLSPLKFIEKAAAILAKEGDIHIINVKFFFKQDVDKSHPLRYKIKAIVFGTLYGKLAKGLARELKIEVEEAQSLIDIMFERWADLKSWIDETHEIAQKTYLVHYPNHRIRHLWSYIHDDVWIHYAQDRRAVNSPIQGFSSDIGVVAIDCYKKWVWENITRKGFFLDTKHVNLVHDAQYSDNLFEHMPMAIYLTEHSMSTLPMDYYREKFNYDISIPLSYGIEFGKNWAELEDWNFRVDSYITKVTDKKSGKEVEKKVKGLLDMLRDEGERLEKSPKQIKRVLEDTEYIMDIRQRELKEDPYRMLIRGNSMSKLFDDLHMFREQA